MIVVVMTTSLPEIVVVLIVVSPGVVVGGVGITIGEDGTPGGPVLGLGVVLAGGVTSPLIVFVMVTV